VPILDTGEFFCFLPLGCCEFNDSEERYLLTEHFSQPQHAAWFNEVVVSVVFEFEVSSRYLIDECDSWSESSFFRRGEGGCEGLGVCICWSVDGGIWELSPGGGRRGDLWGNCREVDIFWFIGGNSDSDDSVDSSSPICDSGR